MEINIQIVVLVGRIIFGGYFVMMGINHFMKKENMTQYAKSKGVPSPHLAVIGTGLLLLLGGLGVATGVYESASLGLLLIFLAPTTFIMHQYWKIEDPQAKMAEMVNFLKNMALIGAILIMFGLPTPWALGLL